MQDQSDVSVLVASLSDDAVAIACAVVPVVPVVAVVAAAAGPAAVVAVVGTGIVEVDVVAFRGTEVGGGWSLPTWFAATALERGAGEVPALTPVGGTGVPPPSAVAGARCTTVSVPRVRKLTSAEATEVLSVVDDPVESCAPSEMAPLRTKAPPAVMDIAVVISSATITAVASAMRVRKAPPFVGRAKAPFSARCVRAPAIACVPRTTSGQASLILAIRHRVCGRLSRAQGYVVSVTFLGMVTPLGSIRCNSLRTASLRMLEARRHRPPRPLSRGSPRDLASTILSRPPANPAGSTWRVRTA